jgi:hypothetical protein
LRAGLLIKSDAAIIEADLAVELPEGGIKLAYFFQENSILLTL